MLDQILSLLDMGGPVVAILTVLSIISLAIVLYKLWRMHSIKIGRHGDAKKALAMWQRSKNVDPISLIASDPSPLSRTLSAAMSGMLYHHDKGALIREDIDRVAGQELAKARTGIRLLETIGQVAPLLGLFGTVLGMIEAFQKMQSAGATVDPSALAGGIWVALLTTAVGLAVAIPASMLATWFDARIDREQQVIEAMVTSVLTGDITSNTSRPAVWDAAAVDGSHAIS